MVISKYGFTDVAEEDLVTLDPSRVAAQIVSGIGFIGAGLVFVRYNKVRGLTTAASIWLTAAVGSAAGAGLVVTAAFVTACHFLILLPVSGDRPEDPDGALATEHSARPIRGRHRCVAQHPVDLHRIRGCCTRICHSRRAVRTRRAAGAPGRRARPATLPKTQVEVELDVEGGGPLPDLVARLSELTDVISVHLEDPAES
jgi:putative Mg2+ transporter-C (MgtC) family protein